MANSNLTSAKRAKNDEFYTQYPDIEKEIAAYVEFNPDVFRDKVVFLPCDDPEWSNFTKFFAQRFQEYGLKKLVSTSYAADSKNLPFSEPTPRVKESKNFDPAKDRMCGKIYMLTGDKTGDGNVNVDDLEWEYMSGDGDFRNSEVRALRDEADIIITNPPFSLFREFLAWVVEADKQFLLIGNLNAITCKEVFPLIQANKMWLGNGFNAGNAYFSVSPGKEYASGVYDEKTGLVKFRNCCWFSNIDHGRRHQPLQLMSMADNLRYNKKLKGIEKYAHYDNYDAIEVPFTDAIPSDYDGVMGVPISFLDKYSPEQFEIIWQAIGNTRASAPKEVLKRLSYRQDPEDRGGCTIVNGNRTYGRILIKRKV